MKPLVALIVILELTVFAGKHDRLNTPAKALVTLPASLSEVRTVVLKSPDGREIVAQLTPPGLLSGQSEVPQDQARREVHFILPELKAAETLALEGTIRAGEQPALKGFRWHDVAGEYAELTFGGRPVLRYVYTPLDESSEASRELTYKVFHHLFDPSGARLVTKGPGGLYTHHRGLFYGFNQITYGDGKKVDAWHCSADAHQSHEAMLSSETGPVVGRHRVAVDWHGLAKEVFAKEERELTAHKVPGGVMLEFASRLRSTGGTIKLDGDPQHAGFHFRADNEVAEKTGEQTYFLRPDGKGKPGETRNWPGDNAHVNLPWNAMSFLVGGKRYTVAYLDKPTNPKEARFSERSYGRFGSYFEYELDAGSVLDVNYRIWLQEGETTVEEVAAKSADFVEPVKVTARVGYSLR